MNTSPAISVLTTVYNREKYLADCIESVQKSHFQDYEHIIVDDGSTDGSLQIAKDYAKIDDRIRVFQNEKNLGDYPNRNQAASYAIGKYLKYIDADDLVYPFGLGILHEFMESFPEAGWGLCSLPQDRERPFPFQLSTREAYQYHYLGPGLFHKAPLSSIIKRDLFERVGGFKPGRMVGDTEMWHRLALVSPVVCMTAGVVWYREHGEQEFNDVDQFRDQYEAIRRDYLGNTANGLSKDELKFIELKRKRTRYKRIFLGSLKRLLNI